MRKICIFIVSIIVYVYVCNITLLPSNVIIFQGEELNLRTVIGLNIRNAKQQGTKAVQASNNMNSNNTYASAGSYELNLDLFGAIPVKEINVNVIERTKVIPCGDLIGVKMYVQGAYVVGMSEIEGNKPYDGVDIREGDTIVEINNNKIFNTNDLVKQVNVSNGEYIDVKYVRDGEVKIAKLKPTKNGENEYKLGLWVRDAAAGVGTLTFIEPSTGGFAALGHGIVDNDTGGIFNISNGELVGSELMSIKKGKKNEPGEIRGLVNSVKIIGDIYRNTNFGIYGKANSTAIAQNASNTAYDVALRSEIKDGEAEIICQLENGVKKSYKIKIEKIYTSNNFDNKSMLIKVTDRELLEKTGGIIQGMSGSPIIQNNKFIGAVTNVLVSDPTTGYAVFGDMMIKQMRDGGH